MLIRILFFIYLVMMFSRVEAQFMFKSGFQYDGITQHLTTSLSNYLAADDGDWVIITATEYDDIKNDSWSYVRYSNTASGSSSSSGGTGQTIRNKNEAADLNYLVSFLILYKGSGQIKIKYSDAINTGFSDIGSAITLPYSASVTSVRLLRKSPTLFASSYQYTAVYYGNGLERKLTSNTGGAWYANGDNSSITSQLGTLGVFFESISSYTKEW